MIRATKSFEQPWPRTAQNLREHDVIGFAKYRDTFYSFTRLAGRTAKFAIASFEDSQDGREELRAFLHRNGDIGSFLIISAASATEKPYYLIHSRTMLTQAIKLGKNCTRAAGTTKGSLRTNLA